MTLVYWLLPLAMIVIVGWAPVSYADGDNIQNKTGVLVYTHGIPFDPLAHKFANDRITAIETYLEAEQRSAK